MEALWENRWLSLKLALQPLHDYPFTKFSWEYDASLVSDDQNCAFEGISASWLLLPVLARSHSLTYLMSEVKEEAYG